jgi:hypothetical protein
MFCDFSNFYGKISALQRQKSRTWDAPKEQSGGNGGGGKFYMRPRAAK